MAYGAMAQAMSIPGFFINHGVTIYNYTWNLFGKNVDGPNSKSDKSAVKAGRRFAKKRRALNKETGKYEAGEICEAIGDEEKDSPGFTDDLTSATDKSCVICKSSIPASAAHGGEDKNGNWRVPGSVGG